MKGQLGDLLKQAQQMQEKMKAAQEELARAEVTGEAGGGMVSVTMNGRHEVRRVAIDRTILADEPALVEDLVAAAVNDAVRRVAEQQQEQMAGLTSGLPLPPGFKLF